MTPAVVKVKPWSDDQGPFVLINEADFEPGRYELVDPQEQQQPAPQAQPKKGGKAAPKE